MSNKYVAFLRGINLGKRTVKMDELRSVFDRLGFHNAQTVIASGNVLFDANKLPKAKEISAALLAQFGFEVGVILRSIKQLEGLIELNLFADYSGSKDIKLYHTLCANPIDGALDEITNQPGDFDLLRVKDHDFFCVAFRQPSGRFGAGMDKLERLFKNNLITTRNWNTIVKIVAKAKK